MRSAATRGHLILDLFALSRQLLLLMAQGLGLAGDLDILVRQLSLKTSASFLDQGSSKRFSEVNFMIAVRAMENRLMRGAHRRCFQVHEPSWPIGPVLPAQRGADCQSDLT
ncbi:hypothetical protein J2R80_008228 [Bradyrhizobium sp. USDA 4541]|nr:hypothetical protein [Bradyrhizobium sp. USDA 4541]